MYYSLPRVTLLLTLCKLFYIIFCLITLNKKKQLLDPIADDDVIDWKIDIFEMCPNSAKKQAVIRTQIYKLLELGVIEESQASEWRN